MIDALFDTREGERFVLHTDGDGRLRDYNLPNRFVVSLSTLRCLLPFILWHGQQVSFPTAGEGWRRYVIAGEAIEYGGDAVWLEEVEQ